MKATTRRQLRRPNMRRAVILFPSGLTLGNLFFGVFAIITASRGEFRQAGVMVLLGGACDALDGQVARATNAGTQFGEELDSLVDAISFGLAPGLIMYFAVLNRDNWDWLVVFLFAACAVMRLARFNIEQAGTAKTYFQGLPSPAAGITLGVVLLVQPVVALQLRRDRRSSLARAAPLPHGGARVPDDQQHPVSGLSAHRLPQPPRDRRVAAAPGIDRAARHEEARVLLSLRPVLRRVGTDSLGVLWSVRASPADDPVRSLGRERTTKTRTRTTRSDRSTRRSMHRASRNASRVRCASSVESAPVAIAPTRRRDHLASSARHVGRRRATGEDGRVRVARSRRACRPRHASRAHGRRARRATREARQARQA